MSQFKHLLSPAKLGPVELRNRIILSPMGDNFADEEGYCTEQMQAYYEARAAGGAGLIIMGVVSIAFPHGTAEPFQCAISDDKYIPGLAKLAERVHKHGAKVAMQIQHAGKVAARDLAEGRELWVPSMPRMTKNDIMASLTQEELGKFISSQRRDGNPTIRVMDKDDIAQMVEWFAAAAERAEKAGFDGVEIHAAHNYIIAGFLSPYHNQRDDEYGGSLENRVRFMREVIRAVRARVSPEFGVWIRLDAYELHTEGGIHLDEAKQVAKIAAEEAVHAIAVSAYATITTGSAFTEAPLVQKPAGFLDWAAEVRAAVDTPVIALGRIEPEVGNKAIAEGRCDFIAMGRKLLADPELPNKLAAGKPETIRPCIYCYVCVSQIFINERIKCAANPFTGQEHQQVLLPAPHPKHVVIVGGGPAGMEAARVASLRGHRVTLIERSNRLGGTLFFAALAYPENGVLLDNLVAQVKELPIEVRFNTEATPELLDDLNADHVFVATGAKRDAPNIPGADLKHVWSGDELRRLMTGDRAEEIAKKKLSLTQRTMMKAGSLSGATNSRDALQGLSKLWMPLGKNVAIIGGGLVGLELAEFLIERGRKVTVLEPGPALGAELSIVRRWRVLDNLRDHQVPLLTRCTVSRIDADQVHYVDQDHNPHTVAAHSVVLAIGAGPDRSLADRLAQHGLPVTAIGDCQQLGYIEGALRGGTDAALAL
ncbi:FAD-dependent oxidoreductase [Marinobacter sp. X15-166B]|uniref:oxidoreductase n=1 Tax=Marinobacter sp. X15-166B TaxID=1897620 RepID=UPI00085BF176|nr:FAD-dependent oxidoreductase [Marinobacter sp. X15-166B]OEY66308.1 effector protein [Marinobacter sp. X15-166B]